MKEEIPEQTPGPDTKEDTNVMQGMKEEIPEQTLGPEANAMQGENEVSAQAPDPDVNWNANTAGEGREEHADGQDTVGMRDGLEGRTEGQYSQDVNAVEEGGEDKHQTQHPSVDTDTKGKEKEVQDGEFDPNSTKDENQSQREDSNAIPGLSQEFTPPVPPPHDPASETVSMIHLVSAIRFWRLILILILWCVKLAFHPRLGLEDR